MKKNIRSILFLVLLFWASQAYSQAIPPTEEEVRTELEKRGIDEDELRAKLSENGIDLDDLENLTPDQFIKMEAIIAELEAKQAPINTKQVEEKSEPALDGEAKSDSVPASNHVLKNRDIERSFLPEPEIFGQQFFRDNSFILKNQTEDIKAPSNYVLGPGDEVLVSIWGRSQLDAEFKINKEGYIRIRNERERVFLKGLTMAEATVKLRSRFAQSYSFNQGEFDVNLNYSRAVSINIMGEVINPGTVTISAANSAFNALVAANGPNNLGSVRNILLVLNEGGDKKVDLYQFFTNPNIVSDLFVSEGDLIYVPVAKKVVDLKGAVKRPYKYELTDEEGIIELMQYAGGFKENAYRSIIHVKRFENGLKRILDIDYEELIRQNQNFLLQDGDEVSIREITSAIENFVVVNGAVDNEGDFERTAGMKVSDLINKAGLKNNAFTDFAYLVRTNPDGSKSFEKIELASIIQNPDSNLNLVLNNRDEITIWSRERFADEINISVEGAVRFPDEYSYDVGQSIRASDAVFLSGGLRRDASELALIHREDPLNENEKKYFRINIQNAVNNPSSIDNIVLQPFDRLEVLSNTIFSEQETVTIHGAVNNPGDFQYGDDMKIKDLLALAGGFKLGAATDRIEVSRVIIKENAPTKTEITNISLNGDLNSNAGDAQFTLQAFDIVSVRYVPEFNFQQNISIVGEVSFPGSYSLIDDNEQISDIIERAGGVTLEAFPAGATLYRKQDSIGYIIMRLDEVLKNKSSKYNFILKDGDILEIPKQLDFVTIAGATRVQEVYHPEVIDKGNSVKVAFHKGKNAKFYIDNYAGGMSESAQKNLVFVQHPNGEIEKTKHFLFFKKYPSVRKGSIIRVGYKPPKIVEEKETNDVDWTRVLSDSVAQAMSVLTLILLIQRLD